MADTWVWRDGQRLTAWMLYCILLLDADMWRLFGVHVIVSSAIRTYAEQEAIFRARYVTAGNVNGRYVYDTRWWNGQLWYRISSAGTVAAPGSSNHEVQGTTAAVDLRDTGSDGGIATWGSARSNWLRANAAKYGLIASGFNFNEAWHYDIPNIWKTPPGGGNTVPPKEKPMTIVTYHREDATARSKSGRTIAKGGVFYLHTTPGIAVSQASNIVGGIGNYQFALHVYAEGVPGDVLEVALLWDDTKTAGPHSPHYVESLTFDSRGLIRASFPFQRPVASGYAVYARMSAPGSNTGDAKVTVFDSDAMLFQ